jgi:predicted aminopeptidase
MESPTAAFRSRFPPCYIADAVRLAFRSAAVCGLLALTTACHTGRFYWQAVRGQSDILARQQSIAQLTNSPTVPDSLKRQLQQVQQLTDFADRRLRLPSGGAYRKYADLERPYVVWNVFAADEFSVEARTWWYPLVGRLKYQGYFQESRAREYSGALKARGLDVSIGPVKAYSTLGWFRDPVLNTWINDPDTELAELIFHELTHRKLFIPGDTDFNEAFATATSRICVKMWLEATGQVLELKLYTQRQQDDERFRRAVRSSREDLAALYATLRKPAGRDAQRIEDQVQMARDQKRRIMEALQREFPEEFRHLPNNARLAQIDTYERYVPAFERLHQASASKLDVYFDAVRKIGKIPKSKRFETLERLTR